MRYENSVLLHGISSSIKTVTCSVPQGYTLGPLLFLLLCINDLQCVFSRSIMDHFTDDTNLKLATKKLVTIESITNNTLIANNELKHLVQ